MLPLLSVIIVTYQASEFISRCLRSVLSSDYSALEVILVDNASTDGTTGLIEREFANDPRVRVLNNGMNIGFAKANNQAVAISRGEYLLFLNPDTSVDSLAVRELVETMHSDATVAIAQPKLLLMYTDPPRIDSTGDLMDPYANGYRRGVGQVDRHQFDHGTRGIFSARGAAMIARRNEFIRAGMFDEDFFLYLEDMDLCWRIRLAGKSIKYVPKAVVFHAAAGSRDQAMLAWAWFHVFKNQIATITKNYSWRYLPKALLCRLLCYAIAAIYYPLVKTQPGGPEASFLTQPAPVPQMVRAVLAGVLWNVRSLKQILSKRGWIQTRLRTVSDEEVLAYMEKQKPLTNFLRQISSSGAI